MKFGRWIPRTLAGLGACSLWAAQGASSQAEHRAQAQLPALPRLEVEAVQMPAWMLQSELRTPLAPADDVSHARQVETGEAAALLLRLAEGGKVRLDGNSRKSVERLAAQAAWAARAQAGGMAPERIEPGQGVAIEGGAWRVVALNTVDAAAALDLSTRLREAGYPAVLRTTHGVVRTVQGARSLSEVSILNLASLRDAIAVLDKVSVVPGVIGSVARG